MIEQFATYLVNIKGYSYKTAKAYVSDCQDFARYMQGQRADARWSNITRKDIDNFVTEAAKAGLKASTTNRKLAAISGLFRWFQREGMLTENPAKYESRRKIGEQAPNTIDTQDLQKAYEHAHGAARIMLGLLATTGMRIGELMALTWSDVNLDTNEIRVTGKGNKQRICYATDGALKELKVIRQYVRGMGRIFTCDDRQARWLIYNALRPYSNARQLSPHAIRHSYATNLAKANINVTTIAQALGHKSIETTQKYIDLNQHNIAAINNQYSLIN